MKQPPKGVAAIIIAQMKKNREDRPFGKGKIEDEMESEEGEMEDEGMDDEGLMVAAEDILSAIQNKDAEMLKEALHSFYMMCKE